LVVLQDATFVNQSLLISRDIAILSENRFEYANRRLKARPHREFRTVGAPNIDYNLFFFTTTHSRFARIALRTHNLIGIESKSQTIFNLFFTKSKTLTLKSTTIAITKSPKSISASRFVFV
jgi:hypothetical protein